MSAITVKINDEYKNKVQKPWQKKVYNLSVGTITPEYLASELKKGNPKIKGIKVKILGREGDEIKIKYKGKSIDLSPIDEFIGE